MSLQLNQLKCSHTRCDAQNQHFWCNWCNIIVIIVATLLLLSMQHYSYYWCNMIGAIFERELRYAPIIYRPIDAALIGSFSSITSYIKIKFLAIRDHLCTLGFKGLKSILYYLGKQRDLVFALDILTDYLSHEHSTDKIDRSWENIINLGGNYSKKHFTRKWGSIRFKKENTLDITCR